MPHNSQLSQIKLYHWNANGICNKWDEVENFIVQHKIDIMAIAETKLAEDIKLSIQGFEILRKDRDRQGGGVLLICRNNLPLHQLSTQTQNLEAISIMLNDKHAIFSV